MVERFTRSFELAAQEPHGDDYIIEGRAICYNTPALIRGKGSTGKVTEWYEVIDPAALAACDTSDVPMLLEHDRKEVIARSRGGSLQFTNKPDGFYIQANMQTGRGREVWESVKAGLLTAFSFAFPLDSVMERDGTHEGLPLMRVKSIPRLMDISVVLNPAYQGAFANARSADFVADVLEGEKQKQQLKFLLEVSKE
jgi:HK97 family phage prohead protease